MKNVLKKCVILISFIMVFGICTISYATDTVKGNIIQEYNGKTYSCINYLPFGIIKDASVSKLPYQIMFDRIDWDCPENHIYKFAIYNKRIYYLKGIPGTEMVMAHIYSCNLDGSDIRLIANDADGMGNFILSDGYLYYKVLYDYENYYCRYLNGGIMKVNLNTGEYGKIITDECTMLINILDDNIFYAVGNEYHLMKCDGRYIGRIAFNDIEVSTVISGNLGYYCENGSICSRDWNGTRNWICDVPRYVEGYSVHTDSSFPELNVVGKLQPVLNVTGGYIYYRISPGMMADCTDLVLMKVPVFGGKSTLVGKWFMP